MPPKFSPGPWRVDRWREGYIGLPKRGIYAGGNSQPIAFATGTPRSSEVNDANAHLIIAAPDMYDALRMVIDSLITLAPYPPESAEAVMAIVEIARAALAKAEDGDAR